jgi:signal peptidase I
MNIEITKKKMLTKIIMLLISVLLLAVYMALDLMKVAIINQAYVIVAIVLSILFAGSSLLLKHFASTPKVKYYLYQILDFFSMFNVALLFMQIFFLVGFFPATVHKSSMYPTLAEADHLLVRSTEQARRFDIVVLKVDATINALDQGGGVLDSELLVKRVIAVGGETFYFENGRLYINEVLIEQDFLTYDYPEFDLLIEDVCKIAGADQCTPGETCVIPENYFFVMGDNRSSSVDSRVLGLFSKDQIVGVAIYKEITLFEWVKL